jgi:hypothetical protein
MHCPKQGTAWVVCYFAVTALTERFCQNACSQGWGRSVQRYFFTIHGQDRVEDDPDGTYVPDVAAAGRAQLL